MKRALIGGFIALIGTIWSLAIIVGVSNNLVSGWSTPPGRFVTSVQEMGMSAPLVIAILLVAGGLAMMIAEYFKKD